MPAPTVVTMRNRQVPSPPRCRQVSAENYFAGIWPRFPLQRGSGVALLIAGLALLMSCAGPSSVPQKDSAAPRLDPELAFTAGEYAEAARLWQQQALSQTGSAAGASRVRSADAWLLADRSEKAQKVLAQIDKAELTMADQAVLNLVLADLALRADRPDEAKDLLREAAADLPVSARVRYEQLLRNTTLMLARPGSRDISGLLAQMESSTSYQAEMDLRLLQSLQEIPSGELALRAANSRGSQSVAGWLELALVIRQNLVDAATLEQDVTAWKGRYPQHYLTETDALELWLLYRQQFIPPQKIAVLLPGAGRLQAASEALRDGIMSGFLDSPGGAEIFFLSTGEEGELATSAYLEARDLGASWIIGPLQKPEIETLLSLPDLATPLLALNDLPADYMPPPALSGQIYGISLSPDEEALALTREIGRSGFQRAIILAPASEWGERMAQNFQENFLQEKGQIVASSRYQEEDNDHSSVLEQLLKIDDSKARKQQLENALQMSLRFEPVRRNDVDVIFLVANPNQGRLLRPQLRFHNAGDIPVYAPSRIYAGKPDSIHDQDLNGVRFPTTPVQLNMNSAPSPLALSSLRGGSFTALFALGQDAWDLLPWLELMRQDPDFVFAGASGSYHSGTAGNLQRDPAFAEFRDGVPVPLHRPAGATAQP